MKKKAFTLIELIAVLVILAILALIVTPLVMSIIRKARISADKRSVDAYGRSIELAIASYLLDTGKFPTTVEQLTIEYSGNQVVCETTQLNSDSSVYLAGCTVAGRSVGDYTYGKYEAPTYQAYAVGDEVTYNGVDYYVIKDSGETDSTLKLLKADALTVDEVNLYGGVGTVDNHVNKYTENNNGTAQNFNGYGLVAYYTGLNCGLVNYDWVYDGCTTDYEQSDVKYIVDAWKAENAPGAIEARLMGDDEFESLGYVEGYVTPSDIGWTIPDNLPTWVYNPNYTYWTMIPFTDSIRMWSVHDYGYVYYYSFVYNWGAIRPVIVLPKLVL